MHQYSYVPVLAFFQEIFIHFYVVTMLVYFIMKTSCRVMYKAIFV